MGATASGGGGLDSTIWTANPLAATAQQVTSGVLSTVLQVKIDCTLNPGEDVYVPFYNSAAPVVGTTTPRLLLKGKAGLVRTYTFKKGLSGVFGTACYAACVSNKGGMGTTAPTGTVKVYMKFNP